MTSTIYLKRSLSICLLALVFYSVQSYSIQNQPSSTRIVSLSPHTTEMLFSAGGGNNVVGVVNYSDYPPQALEIENIGSYHSINIEKIIQLNPDLIVAWKNGNRVQDIDRLQSLGFDIFYSDPHKLSDIPKEIRKLGAYLKTQELANHSADALEKRLAVLQEKYAQKTAVKTYYQIWNKPMMTINGEQFISQAISLCGGQNIFADAAMLTPEVSIESIIHANPKVILLGGQRAFQPGWLKEWQYWKSVDAVRKNNIFLLDINIYQRPTERFIHGLEDLCQKIDSVRKVTP